MSDFFGFRGRFQKKNWGFKRFFWVLRSFSEKNWGFWHDFYRFGMKSARSRVSVGQCQSLMNEKRQKSSVGAVCGGQKIEKYNKLLMFWFAHACLKQTRAYGGCNMSYKSHDSCSSHRWRIVVGGSRWEHGGSRVARIRGGPTDYFQTVRGGVK